MSRDYPTPIQDPALIRAESQARMPTKNRRPSVVIFTETKWAYGQIFKAVQKYSKQFDINIVSWENGMLDAAKFAQHDLVYATAWDIARKLELMHPQFNHK